MQNLIQEYSVASQYFAPRGRERLMFLGEQISHRHLNYNDRLIGIVGDAGSGKSSLIKGMFPGLGLANDDDSLDPSQLMQMRDMLDNLRDASTYHIDMRFQMAFTQMFEIVEFVKLILSKGKRIVIEHFNLLYPALGRNADLMVGIGEEILVARPSIFGPLPQSLYEMVHESLKFRKMAHTVEDITIEILEKEMGVGTDNFFSSDIRNGYVLKFLCEISLDFEWLSNRINQILAENLSVSYLDENHIMIGQDIVPCTGPRLHVKNTSEVSNFELVKRFIYDPKTNTYCLVGLIDNDEENIANRNTSHFLKR